MKKNKKFFTLALVAMLGVVAAVVGTTAAWFTSTASATGSVTTGAITSAIKVGTGSYLTGTSNASVTFKSSVVMPGDSVCDAIVVKVTCTDSRGVYMRASMTVSGTTATITPTLGDGWSTLTSGYYYYGTSASPTAVTGAKLNSDISFCTGATLPTTTGNGTNNANQGATITITVTLEVVQVANNTTPSWTE